MNLMPAPPISVIAPTHREPLALVVSLEEEQKS
ncbi:hypothetical protein J2T22_001205 [Pseudarthrobacter defluvii]|uniref:Uncharacterized protein n=1 Tax=Pseudarthrobacter defluvii TaxID=410837 RepID=A0ABT9UGD7_9MICC|nr:hypothetical protein [Pseudarthrobacter defluvii]